MCVCVWGGGGGGGELQEFKIKGTGITQVWPKNVENIFPFFSFFFFLFFLLFSFFFAKHISVGRLFRNVHPLLQYSSRSLMHASLYDFFSPHVHPVLRLFPLVTVYTVFVCKLCHLNISEPELIFKHHGQ